MTIITVQTAAARSGFSEDSIGRFIAARGAFKAQKLGRSWAIDEGSFAAWQTNGGHDMHGWLTLKWASTQYKISQTTIRSRIKDGTLDSQMVSHKVFIRKDQIAAFAETYDADEARSANGRKAAAEYTGATRQPAKALVLSDDPPPGTKWTPRVWEALWYLARVEDIRRTAQNRIIVQLEVTA